MDQVVSLEDRDGARDRVVAALRAGTLAVVPTDSVYALAADAFAPIATRRLLGAKRRSRNVPLPVLIRSPRQTTGMVEDIPEVAERLMAAYWPGPVTLVFRASAGVTWDLGDVRGTVALRMPTDDLLLSVIAEVGPLAVTAANRRGEPVPTTVEEARRQLGASVAVYVDGGERHGPTSTIVDVTRGRAEVLREGAVPAADVDAVASGRTGWGMRPTDAAPTGAAPTDAPTTEEI